MFLTNNSPAGATILDDSGNIQFQPEFPLAYSGTHGAYVPITGKFESLQQDFINLLKTAPGTWPHRPAMGVGLRHYLFEFHNSQKMNELEPTIRSQVERFLPAIKLIGVEIAAASHDIDESLATIKIRYIMLGETEAELSAEITAGRIAINSAARARTRERSAQVRAFAPTDTVSI